MSKSGMPPSSSVAVHVERNARKFPRRTALIGENGRRSYAELDEQANRLAHYLLSKGIHAGDHVALVAKSSINWVVAFVAIAKIRAVCVPLNYRLTPEEVASSISDARCRFVLTTTDYKESLLHGVDLPAALLDEDTTEADGLPAILKSYLPEIPGMEYSDEDLLLIMFTGGTTGRSKGVMLRNRQVFCNTVHEALDTGMNERDNTILATPLHHSAALNCWLLPHLYLGACATIMTEFSPGKMADMIEQHKATNGFAPPSMARELCQAAEAAPHKLASFRRWYIGGGVLPPKDRDRIHALVPGARIFYQYGLTEAGPIVTVLKEEDYELASDSIGRPFVNFEVRIVNAELGDALPGEPGEMLVRGPSVMDGYFENEEATDAVFHDGWLRTGDMGAMDENGFVYFHDRLKDMVKTGGLNVYSQEVERALQKFPAVQEVAVIGLPSEKWGEEVVAVVAARDGTTIRAEELIAFAKTHLASYKAPKRVIVIPYEQFPINYSGKIIKRTIRARLRERLIAEEGISS
ncbi:MAG: AMP-binding protein [Betaproteobacteria bacterium]|nr:AMP-binding protein [Betaproteobacteria bacterium]